MARHDAPIDITTTPDLLRVVEEVQATGRSRVLQRAGEDVAVLMPTRSRRARRGRAPRAAADPSLSRSVRRSVAIVERTAGVFTQYARRPPPTVEEERAALEQAIAEEVVERMEG